MARHQQLERKKVNGEGFTFSIRGPDYTRLDLDLAFKSRETLSRRGVHMHGSMEKARCKGPVIWSRRQRAYPSHSAISIILRVEVVILLA